jgi:hypothetical protein
VNDWRANRQWADPRYEFGIGYGADMNGFGAQGGPRGADVPNPVTYPFEGFGGVTIDQQVSGERVYDINVDGVAHYGLYPDWIEDIQKVAGDDADALMADMVRGPEAYLQTWERALGIAPDACLSEVGGVNRDVVAAVRKGMTTREVLGLVGQPDRRIGDEYGYCIAGDAGATSATVVFDDGGTVRRVRFEKDRVDIASAGPAPTPAERAAATGDAATASAPAPTGPVVDESRPHVHGASTAMTAAGAPASGGSGAALPVALAVLGLALAATGLMRRRRA